MTDHRPVYLDYNATTPIDPAAGRAMEPWLTTEFGNPASSDHQCGWNAAEAIEQARTVLLDTTHAAKAVFTSGATEALNTVLRSYIGWHDWDKKRIVTCATEHEAVLATSRHLCRSTGVALQVLPVDGAGGVDLDALRRALDDDGRQSLVCLMAANNEIGTLHPVREIGEVVHRAGGWWLCDTTQAIGRIEVDLAAAGIDFATISAHKIYGPKGAGTLLISQAVERPVDPLILGGSQEFGLRGGTANVPGIVGLGAACRLVSERRAEDTLRAARLRDRLESGIQSQVPDTWVNGDVDNRLCNTTNIGFKGIPARLLIRDMHDVAVSTKSACSSGDARPSHVLSAIGLTDQDAYSCVRFSLGRFTSADEIEYAIDKVVTSVHKLRRHKSARV